MRNVPCLRLQEKFVEEIFFVSEEQNVSERFQKHFVSATNLACTYKQANMFSLIFP